VQVGIVQTRDGMVGNARQHKELHRIKKELKKGSLRSPEWKESVGGFAEFDEP
jgi:hypothetical protein